MFASSQFRYPLILILAWTSTSMLIAQPRQPDRVEEEPVMLAQLNVKDADLRDVFRTIAREYGLNLVVDNRIDTRVTVQLADVPVLEALQFLCQEHNLRFLPHGVIYRIQHPPETPPPPPPPLDIVYQNEHLSVDLADADLSRVLRRIQEVSGVNIALRKSVRGTVSGLLQEVDLKIGLVTLLTNNGFSLREKDGIYHVDRLGMQRAEAGGAPNVFWVQVDSGRISLDVQDAPIQDVLRELAAQSPEVGLVMYQVPDGQITAQVDGQSMEETLTLVLKGTGVTYRRTDNLYTIGNAETHALAETRLNRLNHLRPDTALELIPELLSETVRLQVVKEHNGLLATGSPDELHSEVVYG